MIPLKDDAPRITTPYVTYVLVLVNTIIFLLEVTIQQRYRGMQQLNTIIYQFGVVPARFHIVLLNHGYVPWDLIYTLQARYVTGSQAFLTIFTSMFLHASWLHLIFNMLWLWIFGDNVEDYLGHFRFLVLYFASGVGATLLHTLFNLNSVTPTVGASGAIAGVLGAYFVIYPRARVLTLVPFFFVFFMWLPAWVVLGLWFVLQFVSGAASTIAPATHAGGTAFWAHVGGFLVGMGLVKVFPARARRYYYGM